MVGKNQVVRKHDFIFLPPGVEHAISNSGVVDLVFLGDHLARDVWREGQRVA